MYKQQLVSNPECKNKLVEADRATVVLVKAGEQLIKLGFWQIQSVILHAILQFFIVQHTTAVVVVDSKSSAQTYVKLLRYTFVTETINSTTHQTDFTSSHISEIIFRISLASLGFSVLVN